MTAEGQYDNDQDKAELMKVKLNETSDNSVENCNYVLNAADLAALVASVNQNNIEQQNEPMDGFA